MFSSSKLAKHPKLINHLVTVIKIFVKITRIGKDVEKPEPSYAVGGNVKCCKILWIFSV